MAILLSGLATANDLATRIACVNRIWDSGKSSQAILRFIISFFIKARSILSFFLLIFGQAQVRLESNDRMEQEVFKLKSQLVKTSLPDSSILEILNRLAEFKQMPIKVLSKTEIGITVGKFRKHENVKISSAAKSLIKLWKKQLETASEDSAPKEPELPKISHSESTPVPVPAAPKTFTMPSTRTVKTDNVKVPQKSDRIREKSIEMLYTALASNTDVGKISCLS